MALIARRETCFTNFLPSSPLPFPSRLTALQILHAAGRPDAFRKAHDDLGAHLRGVVCRVVVKARHVPAYEDVVERQERAVERQRLDLEDIEACGRHLTGV